MTTNMESLGATWRDAKASFAILRQLVEAQDRNADRVQDLEILKNHIDDLVRKFRIAHKNGGEPLDHLSQNSKSADSPASEVMTQTKAPRRFGQAYSAHEFRVLESAYRRMYEEDLDRDMIAKEVAGQLERSVGAIQEKFRRFDQDVPEAVEPTSSSDSFSETSDSTASEYARKSVKQSSGYSSSGDESGSDSDRRRSTHKRKRANKTLHVTPTKQRKSVKPSQSVQSHSPAVKRDSFAAVAARAVPTEGPLGAWYLIKQACSDPNNFHHGYLKQSVMDKIARQTRVSHVVLAEQARVLLRGMSRSVTMAEPPHGAEVGGSSAAVQSAPAVHTNATAGTSTTRDKAAETGLNDADLNSASEKED